MPDICKPEFPVNRYLAEFEVLCCGMGEPNKGLAVRVLGRAGDRGGVAQTLKIAADRASSNPHRSSLAANCGPRAMVRVASSAARRPFEPAVRRARPKGLPSRPRWPPERDRRTEGLRLTAPATTLGVAPQHAHEILGGEPAPEPTTGVLRRRRGLFVLARPEGFEPALPTIVIEGVEELVEALRAA